MPGTLRLRSCAAAPRVARRAKRGGARRDRTADLVIANDALSQLSYGPVAAAPRTERGRPTIGAIYSPPQGQVKNGARNPKEAILGHFEGNFPCLRGDEPISSGVSHLR